MSAKEIHDLVKNDVEVQKYVFSLAFFLKDFLQVDLTIRLFGRIIWERHFPPKSV